jgi:hypothetical protein
MFKYLLFVIISLAPYLAFSQINEGEAKAAFLLAEEFYAKSDFKNALGFLDKAKKSLGEGNCKIYYLEILMRNEMYKSDKSQYSYLTQAIDAFQSSKDIDAFNGEKIIEVLKIKMLIAQEQDNKRKADSLSMTEQLRKDKIFNEYFSRGWTLNVPLNDIKSSKANHPFFLKKLDEHKIKDPGVTYYSNDKTLSWFGSKESSYFFINNGIKDSVVAISVGTDGLVKRYVRQKFVKHYSEKDAYTKVQADDYMNTLVNSYTRRLGFEPEKRTYTLNYVYVTTDYVWIKNNKWLMIRSMIRYMKKEVDMHVQEIIGVD